MTDFFYWGGPVYCSTADKIAWSRPTTTLCKPLEGSSNGAFFSTLGADPIGKLLSKAGVAERGSVGFAGFSAFHGFLDPLLQVQAGQVDYVHLADACFQGAGATEAKKGLLAFARRAVAGEARMTVTTNGPWGKNISYSGPAGSKYEGTQFNLTSGAKCFENVWNAAVGGVGGQTVSAEVPAGVPQPDRIMRAGELYWFHYEGTGQKDPHAWHANVLAAPYIQKYGVPWMAGQRGGLSLLNGGGLSAGAKGVIALAGLAGLGVLGYYLLRRAGYVPNHHAGEFPKHCNRCGADYTKAQWKRLPLVGHDKYEWGDILEHRNCPCGTTLAVYVRRAPDDDDPPACAT